MANQSYTLQFTDPTRTIEVPPLTINGPVSPSSNEVYPNSSGSATSIGLIGRGEPNYGQVILNNLLQMLEHFSYPTAPVNPTIGQLWHDNVTDQLNLYTASGWLDVTGSDKFVQKTGGEMSGTLVFPSNTKLHLNYTPSSQVDAINLIYATTNFLSKTGGTVNGNVGVSTGHVFTCTAMPTNDDQLANKAYVDQTLGDVSLTSNRVEKLNPGSVTFTFGNPVSKLDENTIQLSTSNNTITRAVVLGVSVSESSQAGSSVYIQSYGTIVGTTNQWDIVTGGSGGLQTGLDYFVASTPGMITANPPTVSGQFLTKVGTAISPTVMLLDIQTPFRI